MKKESSKERSIKERPEKEGRIESAFSRESFSAPQEVKQEDLRIDFDAFLRFFNQSLREAGSSIAQQAFITKGYKARLQSLAYEYNSKLPLITAVRKMAASDFLNGRAKKYRFKASFVWLFESNEHFERVLSGYYDNPDDGDKTPEEIRAEQEEQRRQKMAEQRALARQIEEEDRERDRLERERMARNAVTPEEAERQGIKLQFISRIMAEATKKGGEGEDPPTEDPPPYPSR